MPQLTRTLFVLPFLLAPAPAGSPSPTLLDVGFAQMYNLEFDDAHRTFADWERLHPDDPMGPVSAAAAYLYAEFDRLGILQTEFFVDDDQFFGRRHGAPDPVLKRNFESALARSEQLSRQRLDIAPQDANALFAASMRLGLRADYFALVEKRYLASLREIKRGRVIAEELLAKYPTYYDAYLAIGVENYMLSLKPAPLRWLLRISGARTDREEGIRKLQLTAEKGRYLRPYARLLLAVAALRDRDKDRARWILADLARQYPRNRLYAHELARLDTSSGN
jgi:hypothetical protein